MRQDIYDAEQNALIEYLIGLHPPLVATSVAVTNEVVGWVCREYADPRVTHFVYVKHAYRRLGIASTLIAGTRWHSHQTQGGDKLFKKRGSLYNPYLLTIGSSKCLKPSV